MIAGLQLNIKQQITYEFKKIIKLRRQVAGLKEDNCRYADVVCAKHGLLAGPKMELGVTRELNW